MNDVMDAGATFRQRLDGVAADIERLLDRLLAAAPLADERARPQRLMDADALCRASAAASGCGRSWWSRPRRCSRRRASAR